MKKGRIILVLVFLLLVGVDAGAQSSPDTQKEFWPEVQAFIELNPKFRIFLNASVSKSVEDGEILKGNAYEGLVGAHLDYVPNQHFFLRVGYRFIKSLEDIDPYEEHRIVVEQHLRKLLKGDILLSDRNREDFRFVNGDFSFRYRNRLTLEREFIVKNRSLTPYASGEIFYDSRFDVWNRNRYSVGMVVSIKRRHAPLKMLFPKRDVTLDLYYMRQNDSRSSPAQVNGFGIAVGIHF